LSARPHDQLVDKEVVILVALRRVVDAKEYLASAEVVG